VDGGRGDRLPPAPDEKVDDSAPTLVLRGRLTHGNNITRRERPVR
jgi:hypothetical protein